MFDRSFFKLLPLAILAIFLIMVAWYKDVKKSGANEQNIKQLKEKNAEQHEIITEQKKVFKRKTTNKSHTTNANLKWLRQNRCKDCKG